MKQAQKEPCHLMEYSEIDSKCQNVVRSRTSFPGLTNCNFLFALNENKSESGLILMIKNEANEEIGRQLTLTPELQLIQISMGNQKKKT